MDSAVNICTASQPVNDVSIQFIRFGLSEWNEINKKGKNWRKKINELIFFIFWLKIKWYDGWMTLMRTSRNTQTHTDQWSFCDRCFKTDLIIIFFFFFFFPPSFLSFQVAFPLSNGEKNKEELGRKENWIWWLMPVKR